MERVVQTQTLPYTSCDLRTTTPLSESGLLSCPRCLPTCIGFGEDAMGLGT